MDSNEIVAKARFPWVISDSLLIRLICLGGLLLVPACTTQRQTVSLETVGPAPHREASDGGSGFLKVYTLYAAWPPQGEVNPVTHRGDYRILSKDGSFSSVVKNHADEYDEGPRLVSLQPGKYRVEAKAIHIGLVAVPVLIKEGETTTVHLDGDGPGAQGKQALTNVVKLPNGYKVGWKAGESATD